MHINLFHVVYFELLHFPSNLIFLRFMIRNQYNLLAFVILKMLRFKWLVTNTVFYINAVFVLNSFLRLVYYFTFIELHNVVGIEFIEELISFDSLTQWYF